jgi:hypothetical protein
MTSSLDLTRLRRELDATHDRGRVARAIELGRDATARPGAAALLEGLAAGEAYERRLGLIAQYTRRDGASVLRALEDPSRRVRALAFSLVPLCCDDPQAADGLQVAFALRRDRALAVRLRAHDRLAAVDHHLDWLAPRKDVHDFADLVALGSPDGIRRHLPQALLRPSQIFWKRLARYAPDALGDVFAQRLRAVAGELDAVHRQLLDRHLFRIADAAPDTAMTLVELLHTRGIEAPPAVWKRLAVHRPTVTLSVMQRCKVLIPDGLFARDPGALSPAALAALVRLAPRALGEPDKLFKALDADGRRAVVAAWCEQLRAHRRWMLDEGLLYWGRALIAHIDDRNERDFAFDRWSEGARDRDGVVAVEEVAKLPEEYREREGRRHLHGVVALGTRPAVRLRYARFLPWDEAESALRVFLGHPEGEMRGAALTTLFAVAGMRPDEPALSDRCLALCLARKNEQDPVRGAMAQGLLAWPKRIWRPEHLDALGQMVRDALDASDCSVGTAAALEALVVRRFHLDPAWASRWLFTLVKERGRIHDPLFARHLDDDDLRVAAPALMEVARQWAERERGAPLLQLARGVGKRMALVPGLGELVAAAMTGATWEWGAQDAAQVLRAFDRERLVALLPTEMRRWYDLGWVGSINALAASWDEGALPEELGAALERVARGTWLVGHIHQALVALRLRDLPRFDRVVEAMIKSDESLVCLPEVHRHLHARRQDLLDPFLGHRVIIGRFANGKTRWILPFERGFHRWNPAQNTRFHATLADLVGDKGRDTPTVFRALIILPRLEFAPADALCALADDTRPAVREKAIRVMARCDAAQGVPTLLDCLDDARARIAIYGLRRALRDVPPARVVTLLAAVSLRKVTVAKEVLRILGELRHDSAYDLLIEVDGRTIHRDVRIALLRGLWDHLEREPTWGVFARAVAADDWVMASRLGDIPADRLTAASDRRLSALLAQVLERPEPEARIDLLQRAAMLAVRDPERSFLRACGARLASPYDDEVRAAMMALLHRADEGDMAALGPMVAAVREDVRALTVGLDALLAAPLRSRAVWTQAGAAAERALEGDARLTALRVRCAVAWRTPADWSAWAQALVEGGAADADTLRAVAGGLASLPAASLRGVTERWSASPSPALRRASVWALERDAGPKRGWTPERLETLRALQADASPEVAGAARAVFPPREMIDERYRARGESRPRGLGPEKG